MDSNETRPGMSYAQLRHAHDQLGIVVQLLTALLAGEAKSYHDSRTETYRNLLDHAREVKKTLPELDNDFPF